MEIKYFRNKSNKSKFGDEDGKKGMGVNNGVKNGGLDENEFIIRIK